MNMTINVASMFEYHSCVAKILQKGSLREAAKYLCGKGISVEAALWILVERK